MATTSQSELQKVSGPASMAKPETSTPSSEQNPVASSSTAPELPTGEPGKPKKKRPRGGKNRRKTRRPSFTAHSESNADPEDRPNLLDVPQHSSQHASFYRLQSGARSNTSLESEALLDHTEYSRRRGQRQSLHQQGFARPSLPQARHRGSQASAQRAGVQKSRLSHAASTALSDDDEDVDPTDRTPLLNSGSKNKSRTELSRNNSGIGYGSYGGSRARRPSVNSKASSTRRKTEIPSRGRHATVEDASDEYDVNNPPSVPGSPKMGSLDDVMIADLTNNDSPDRGRDAVIDIEGDYGPDRRFSSTSVDGMRRRATVADLAERDVCFPAHDGLSEIGEEDEPRSHQESARSRRRKARQWPNLEILEDWSHEEKEERTQQEYIRAKKISEPVMVGGRLRPGKTTWQKQEDDAPFRFTYFNEMLDGTIHARTISDLLQDGATFRDLFLPDPVELSESSDDDEDEENAIAHPPHSHHPNGHMTSDHHHLNHSKSPSATSHAVGTERRSPSASKSNTGSNTPVGRSSLDNPRPRLDKSKRTGARPTFWLDVLGATEDEMRVLSRAFGIHQLTVEDIQVEEPREKVELFSSYYFVNYRSFDQDQSSEEYMEPVSIYVVVFHDGVLTFHQKQTPHPANVRRRIRQLNDYMSPTADWISYAIIDDVTDAYAPLVGKIEEEVDEIDDDILLMHRNAARNALPESGASKEEKESKKSNKEKNNSSYNAEKTGSGYATSQGDMGAQKAQDDKTAADAGRDMLRRVGECRKRVMGLYRLLGNKADVIKGFAKRCNEHWEVAPRSEIGMYLGDIQDHIVTMTGNLSHYENLLSRAHSNYLAQINIRMNERAEQTADVLGKLTVLGTIVLPMNIITGMWGMNVWVPGQEYEGSLTWFWCITAGLLTFGISCYFVAKKVYGIV